MTTQSDTINRKLNIAVKHLASERAPTAKQLTLPLDYNSGLETAGDPSDLGRNITLDEEDIYPVSLYTKRVVRKRREAKEKSAKGEQAKSKELIRESMFRLLEFLEISESEMSSILVEAEKSITGGTSIMGSASERVYDSYSRRAIKYYADQEGECSNKWGKLIGYNSGFCFQDDLSIVSSLFAEGDEVYVEAEVKEMSDRYGIGEEHILAMLRDKKNSKGIKDKGDLRLRHPDSVSFFEKAIVVCEHKLSADNDGGKIGQTTEMLAQQSLLFSHHGKPVISALIVPLPSSNSKTKEHTWRKKWNDAARGLRIFSKVQFRVSMGEETFCTVFGDDFASRVDFGGFERLLGSTTAILLFDNVVTPEFYDQYESCIYEFQNQCGSGLVGRAW